ncbi:hypothetical protein QYF50_07095 [Paenibacillus vini]|uniref:hypothetical protein n=1 Tax=Paenibacillus vini TaxID=1476024 RepID=UPI0025B705CD|nr:hypothetical protein [Paenibacillus vini]MDN4067658.1 hypothetical protein [Paenibacillus vini]
MSNNNNDLYGGSNLFSYFGGNFSTPSTKKDQSEPENIAAEEHDNHQDGSSKVLSFPHKHRTALQKKTEENSCADACENQGLTEEENEALREENVVDEGTADAAELAGQVVKTDNKKEVVKGTKAEAKPVFNNTTFICYSRTSIPLTKYFSDDKLGLLELEDIRKRLEKDFPELSKQRTKMDWDEKKNVIVPIVTLGKKGAFYSEESRAFFSNGAELYKNKDLHPINIFAAQDGYYEIRENPIGVFVVRKSSKELMEWTVFRQFASELPPAADLELCQEGFKMKLPKIPNHLILQLISFFSDYSKNEVEVLGVFYWDSEKNRYYLDVPIQRVTKVSVDPIYSDLPTHFLKVAEVHSVRVVPKQTA